MISVPFFFLYLIWHILLAHLLVHPTFSQVQIFLAKDFPLLHVKERNKTIKKNKLDRIRLIIMCTTSVENGQTIPIECVYVCGL